MRTDLVYRMVPERHSTTVPEGMAFVMLSRARAGTKWFAALRRQFGLLGAFKALAKIASGHRILFAFERDGRFASFAWSTERSPKYAIEPGACILGPLVTRRDMRRKGLATALLMLASVRLAMRGYSAVYIDTVPANIASQRTIVRAGFTPYAVVRDGVMYPVKPGDTFDSADGD